MKRFLSSLLPALVALLWASTASAQFVTGTTQQVQINAHVPQTCVLQSGGGLVVLDSTAAGLGALPDTNTGLAVSVRCTKGTTISVAGSGSGTLACLAGNCTTTGDTIPYTLWVSSTQGGVAQTPVTQLSATALSMGTTTSKGAAGEIAVSYVARFAPTVDVASGDYRDTVTVTYTVAP